MLIELITQDFKGSSYASNTNCPLAKALKRYFPKGNPYVGGRGFLINHKWLIILKKQRYHKINTNCWNYTIACSLIIKANKGEEVSYTLNIPEL